MSDLTIRPTAKFIKAGAIAAAIAAIALEILFLTEMKTETTPYWLMAFPPLLLLWPASRWLRRTYTSALISGDRLRYQVGFASRSTRTIQLSKIQDVRVDQQVSQRMINVGDLSIETAGETSRLVLANVDSPQELADEIMNRAQRGAGAQAQ
jgi:uncharacterized membrane protein YdbT with pleckstrin-like domain